MEKKGFRQKWTMMKMNEDKEKFQEKIEPSTHFFFFLSISLLDLSTFFFVTHE